MKILDLFCGAGGAAAGLYRVFPRAEILGVDVNPQPRYPFRFIQADALMFSLNGYDLIWASPPCQGYSWTSHIHHCQDRDYPRVIEKVRQRLQLTSTPYIIENVVGAPLINPITLCGTMFGLPLRRHRLFEASWAIATNGKQCSHGEDFGVYAGKVTRVGTRGTAYVARSGRTHYRPRAATRAEGARAMEIDWMTISELSQAVPPVYSEWVAQQWRDQQPPCAT